MRRSKLLIFSLMFALIALFALGLNVNVKATTGIEGTGTDSVSVAGAKIRTAGTAGIRFVAEISEDFKEGATKYGVALAFGEADASEILVNGTVNDKSVLTGEIDAATLEVGATQFYVNLINIPNTMYGQKITARAYVVKGEEYHYANTATTRSLGEVVLKASAAGEVAGNEFLEEIYADVADNYKKVFIDQQGQLHIDNPIYETNTASLAKLFVADWNEMFSTTLDASTAFIAKSYDSPFRTSARNNSTTDPTGANITEFFRNEEMYAKWGWMLNYITTELKDGTGYTPCMTQIDCILNNKTDSTGNWYYGFTLVSYIQSIFNGKGTSAGSGQYKFETSPAKLGLIVNYNNTVLADLNNSQLVLKGEYTLPTVDAKAGYEVNGWTDGTNTYTNNYTVTDENVLLSKSYTAIDYTITYYYGEEELTDLAYDYTVEDSVTLPVYTKDGYRFEGWYTNPEFTGAAVTEISKGTTGNIVFYAKMSEVTGYTLTYNFNGGNTKYASKDEVVADLFADISAFKGKTYTPSNMGVYSNKWAINNMYTFFQNETYGAKWMWLVEFFAETETNSFNKTAFNILAGGSGTWSDAQHPYSVEYVLCGFGNNNSYSSNADFVTADYSLTVNNQFWDNLSAAEVTEYRNLKGTTNLIEKVYVWPNNSGLEFLGWYDNPEFDGEAITEVTEETSVYAKFGVKELVEEVYTIKLTAADEAALNALSPSIVVLPSLDYTVYSINGEEYAANETAFESIAEALTVAQENDNIYVFAGTYSDALTVSTAGVTLYGPNYNVAYNGARAEEAVINNVIKVSANNFTLNGIKLTGTNSAIYTTKALSNLNILNVVSTANGVVSTVRTSDSYYAYTVVLADYNLTNLVIKNSSFVVGQITGGSKSNYINAIGAYATLTNADIQNNYFENSSEDKAKYNEAARANKIAGVINFSNNECVWYTSQYILFLGYNSNSATLIDVNDNIFSGVATSTSGLAIRRLQSGAVCNHIGNQFLNISGNTLNFGNCVAGSVANVMYNYFDNNTSYTISSLGSGTINYVNNYYAAAQTTTTSDYGTIANLEALEIAYTQYKASLAE